MSPPPRTRTARRGLLCRERRKNAMKGLTVKGLMTGMLIGGSAAMLYGVMNWRTERKWNAQARKTGRWMAGKADDILGK